MRTTMKEVAAYAKVSVATVSHVINNSGKVKAETRQRVEDAIQKLHFIPDITAKTFKTGKRSIIGCIVPDIRSDFFASIIEEIENILAQKNYKLIVANSKEDPKREIELIKLMSSGLVDGLIISSAFISDFSMIREYLPKGGFPVIFVGRKAGDCPFDSVTISDYNATCQSIEYLIQKGHHRIGYIAGLKHLSPVKERLQAYYDTLSHYNIPVEKKFIKDVTFHAFHAIKELVEDGCTSIVASTNNVTYDAIIYFLNHNISLKDGIALVGYLNDGSTSTELKDMVQILHPVNEMGILAVNQLLCRMQDPELPIKNIVLMGRLVKPEDEVDRAE